MSCVWVYSVIRNEATLLPYWLRHYTSFASRIIVYDDNSDDGSQELIVASGAELRQCPWSGLDDYQSAVFANRQYKESRGQADWVIWVDGDEFLYHPHIAERLDTLVQMGVTMPRVQGYSMLAESLPTTSSQIYSELRHGIIDDSFSKPIIINPYVDILWGLGKHDCTIRSAVTVADNDTEQPLKLLHYRWLGSEYFSERNFHNYARFTTQDAAAASNRIFVAADWNGQRSVQWWQQRLHEVIEVI